MHRIRRITIRAFGLNRREAKNRNDPWVGRPTPTRPSPVPAPLIPDDNFIGADGKRLDRPATRGVVGSSSLLLGEDATTGRTYRVNLGLVKMAPSNDLARQ